ncbi:hypothetical protein MMU07_20920 [Aquiflexum sp. LQ15W]|uniref:hypothetical protein n=1 Tax=Cognataquiflexum nitidum TaxID=2922272 RepID=UPI001F12A98C|nr:hypothetical protein [Cognataquiflexum nitidum]MCH6202052.1 hypothetical protein [Cognataquiflexum nitidum]
MAVSMLEGLKQDNAALQESIGFAKGKDTRIQNFLKMLRSPGESWDTLAFYKSVREVFTIFPFPPQKALIPKEILG